MFFLVTSPEICLLRLKLLPSVLSVSSTQFRWKKKIPTRKPRCLPMSPHKIFRIPKHPYVSPDEMKLTEELLVEYYIKLESLRKSFQDEIIEKAKQKEHLESLKLNDEEKFKLLLEENEKENERVRIIREETLESEFQEKLLVWLQMAEEKKQEKEKRKLEVEAIVRAEKEKNKSYITLQNLDEAIERALDNPININFAITLDGTVKWEGKPPLEYEEEINRRIEEGKRKLHAIE